MNPKSGAGKVGKFDLKRKAEALGAGISAGCSGMRQSGCSPVSAERAVMPASSHAAADTTATQSSPAKA